VRARAHDAVPIMSIYTVKGDHIVADTTYYDRKTL